MDLFPVSFNVLNTSDNVLQIGNATYPAFTTVASLVASDPQYWLENDTNNNTHLCIAKTDSGKLVGHFQNGAGAYTLDAVNFETLSLVGGRPIHRPHAY